MPNTYAHTSHHRKFEIRMQDTGRPGGVSGRVYEVVGTEHRHIPELDRTGASAAALADALKPAIDSWCEAHPEES